MNDGRPVRKVRLVGPFLRFKDASAIVKFYESWRRTRALDPSAWRVISENCLRPYLCDRDVVMIDFDRKPIDGDLVLVAMRYRRAGFIGGEGSLKTQESCKQLRVVNGERYLCAADGDVSADPHEILGTVVAWYRPGWWRRPSPKRMNFKVPQTATSRAAASLQ